ncbi:MAG TPA: L-seryl-tRNA(Sec) selenium transferase, partial [Stenomitos sp.]
MTSDLNSRLRALPSVSSMLNAPPIVEAMARYDHEHLVGALQAALVQARDGIRAGGEAPGPDALIQEALQALRAEARANLRRVVNATGVVLNTNLGRAPLAPQMLEPIAEVACAYSNLEFDLDSGKRGSRYSHVEDLLCRLTGAEAAVVVNNNAAAVLLVVDTFARGHEVVVSRGQLIEIGGSFRIPEVLTASGARLVEVGTTNKTHPEDYERAITPETAMLMRCHTSNYRIVGFTAEVAPEEMVAIARRHGVLSVEDLGSGVLVDLSAYGLPKEPTVQDTVKAGLDLVTFSGDKLLGGPQSGIIVGKKELVAKLKKNHMLRALRQDKVTLAALEQTLRAYLDPKRAMEEVPTLRMLTRRREDLRREAEQLASRLRSRFGDALTISTPEGESQVGGGSLPAALIPTVLVALRPQAMDAQRLADRLRRADPPVVTRIEHDAVLLDPRTLLEGDD